MYNILQFHGTDSHLDRDQATFVYTRFRKRHKQEWEEDKNIRSHINTHAHMRTPMHMRVHMHTISLCSLSAYAAIIHIGSWLICQRSTL